MGIIKSTQGLILLLTILFFTGIAKAVENPAGEGSIGGKEVSGASEELVSLNLQDTDINLLLELYSKLRGSYKIAKR
ncbi:MAG: hypothetical protein HY753_07195 [Nitrospirae bacterium]|nr:hypothetical protein [Nitrospirota bacterium]